MVAAAAAVGAAVVAVAEWGHGGNGSKRWSQEPMTRHKRNHNRRRRVMRNWEVDKYRANSRGIYMKILSI